MENREGKNEDVHYWELDDINGDTANFTCSRCGIEGYARIQEY